MPSSMAGIIQHNNASYDATHTTILQHGRVALHTKRVRGWGGSEGVGEDRGRGWVIRRKMERTIKREWKREWKSVWTRECAGPSLAAVAAMWAPKRR